MATQLNFPFAEDNTEGFLSICENSPNYGSLQLAKGPALSTVLQSLFSIPETQTLALLECLQTQTLTIPDSPDYVDLSVFLRPHNETLQLLAWNFEHEFCFAIEELSQHKISLSLYF